MAQHHDEFSVQRPHLVIATLTNAIPAEPGDLSGAYFRHASRRYSQPTVDLPGDVAGGQWHGHRSGEPGSGRRRHPAGHDREPGHQRRPSQEGCQGHADRGNPDHSEGARGRAPEPVSRLRAIVRAMGRGGSGPAAGLHRRLQQHGDVEARLRLDLRLGAPAAGRSDRRRPRQPESPLERARRPLPRAPEHAPGRLGATRPWRRARPGVSEGGQGGDRPLQARVPRAVPWQERGRHHRRGDPARGPQHGRQARHSWARTSAASCPSRC